MKNPEQHGCFISMNGNRYGVDTRKDLEKAMLEEGADPAIAKSASHILFESMLDTQWKIARDISEESWNKDGKLGCAPCPFPKERPRKKPE